MEYEINVPDEQQQNTSLQSEMINKETENTPENIDKQQENMNIDSQQKNIMFKPKPDNNLVENKDIHSEIKNQDRTHDAVPKIGDFVLVEFYTKKTKKPYVGKILEVLENFNYYATFLRQTKPLDGQEYYISEGNYKNTCRSKRKKESFLL
ncbi:unnamed protein product [Psylliodes chrysocephalus]|uniref:Uncharacterized protein n=1 Tax=Psylliodes chrysocephalus TaxID=3402493 RepID=A0A9P0DAQ7_9CUCU|nr:unnamed protein product [Psylliodes chrysocephala]